MEKSNAFVTPDRLWNRSYIFVLIVSTLTSFSFYMTANIMSKYLVGIGLSVTLAGMVVGLFSITSLASRPFVGLLADRMSNVRLLIISCVFQSAGLLGFALTDSMPLIVLFRIINGIGFAICGTVQVALIVHFIPPKRTGEGIGYIGISQLIGSACAPAAGLEITQRMGDMRYSFLMAAALPLAAAVMLLTMFGMEPRKEKVEKKAVRMGDVFEPKALYFTIPYSTFSFVNGIIASYLVMFADEKGIENISIYFTMYAVCLFVVRPFSGKLLDKKGIRYPVIPGMLITALSMFLLGFCSSLPLILLTGVLRAVGQGAAQPSLQAGCINYVGRDRSGVATSTYFLGGDIGQGIGPMLGGFVVESVAGIHGYQLIFSACGVLILLALAFFLTVCRKKGL